MYNDARIRSAVTTMIDGIAPPPVPLLAILRSAARSPVATEIPAVHWLRSVAAAAAIVGVIAIGVPLIAPGVVESVEARIAQILRWIPPSVPTPHWLTSQLRPQEATLAGAQARVPFTIVPPVGLPRDVTVLSIATSPSGVYDKLTGKWQLGSQVVYFSYRRSGSRSFTLLADRFDPRTGPPSQYQYEDTGRLRDGMPVLVRHEKFTWRNRDQVMTAIDDASISADEIQAIRNAMHGVPVAATQTRSGLDSGTIDKLYISP
jgi:hypothetical protein